MITHTVPTGHIFIVDGDKGKLECLSIGDYGKDANIKADFLGQTNAIHSVPHGALLPLEEKWVITISTQYGCSMGCTFCDVPKVGPGINATFNDLVMQVDTAMAQHPEVIYSDRLNLHYARMGEPTFNKVVLDHMYYMQVNHTMFKVHPVISTMLPKNNVRLMDFLLDATLIKNNTYNGEAGIQFSINSTSDRQRHTMFNGASLDLDIISFIGRQLPMPKGRKYTLNFAITKDTALDGDRLKKLFSPSKFIVKITPIHDTVACKDNGIVTKGGYTSYTPYEEYEEECKRVGFDTLVFIPSIEEDTSRITCGNALLSLL